MTQILLIHGGGSFSSYDEYLDDLKAMPISYDRLKLQRKWKSWIAEQLPDDDVLLPTFPNGYNAVYDEWVIYFEKLIPFFGEDVRLVGHSLGAMFLAKYLHEHELERKARQIILISGRHEHSSEKQDGSFTVTSARGLEKSADEIHLFHSMDDPVVEFASLKGYQQDLPTAISHVFKTRGHFNEPTFPEILDLLKQK